MVCRNFLFHRNCQCDDVKVFITVHAFATSLITTVKTSLCDSQSYKCLTVSLKELADYLKLAKGGFWILQKMADLDWAAEVNQQEKSAGSKKSETTTKPDISTEEKRDIRWCLLYGPANMIAQSQSGTGKTAAFVITMLMRCDVSQPYPQCLCLAPTYELALQIGKNTEDLAKHIKGIRIGYAVRGEKIPRGEKVDYHVVIGTPGTMLDWCLKLKAIDMKKVNVFVLDEADVMIAQQGHQDSCIRIQRQLRKGCQMLLFSATYEDDVMKFAEAIIPNPVTRKTASWLAEKMTKDGHAVALLSGDLTIEQRAAVINRFRDGKEKVTVVVNFDLPLTHDFQPDCETYLHRIGRTGRFGKNGIAINMIDGKRSFKTLQNSYINIQQIMYDEDERKSSSHKILRINIKMAPNTPYIFTSNTTVIITSPSSIVHEMMIQRSFFPTVNSSQSSATVQVNIKIYYKITKQQITLA
ncbi:hypothetical protein KUTeg_002481, partial [Tegillarca granosa]